MMHKNRLRFVVALLVVASGLMVMRRTPRDPATPAEPKAGPEASLAASAGSRLAPPVPPSSGPARSEFLARLAYGQAWEGPLPPAMAAFRNWCERHRAAPSLAARLALLPEGVALARARRAEMRRLIVTDPRRALEVTVPAVIRQTLPAAVLAELETRQAGRGDFALQAAQYAPGAPSSEPAFRRIVFLEGTTHRARAYGRREPQLTKEDASLHGIALDGEFALHENPLRVLEAGEIPAEAAEPACFGCGLALEAEPPGAPVNLAALETVEFAGRTRRLHETEFSAIEARALRAEDLPGPRVPEFDGTGSAPAAPPRAGAAPTPHTVGSKQVLVIRVDFSDFPGEPVSQAAAQSVMQSGVKPFYEDISYGDTTIVPTVSAQTYRMPRTGASYATANDNTALHADARSAAGVHYTLGTYDRIIVVFPNIGTARVPGSRLTYAGLASVAGTNAWINGPNAFVLTTVSHELGHTYGLLHANLWRVRDQNPISPDGTTLEYGDPFDMMGSTSATGITRDARHHFGMWGKNRLGWLPDEAVATVTRSGQYRIYRFDHGAASRNRPLALRVFRDGVRWYWIGLRQNFASGTPRVDGAYVIWAYNQRLQTQLLDLTTPGTTATDAALTMGTTFTDAPYGVSFRPVARGGADPEQWLELEVTVPPVTPPNVIAAWGREGATFFDTETGDDIVPAPETNVPAGLMGVQALAAGDQHALALRSDGTVVAWGNHAAGQIAVPVGLGEVVAIAAGGNASGAVLRDGTVRLWGESSAGVTTPPAELTGVTQLALGRNHALALKTDGTVVAWGSNSQGQGNVPAGLTNVTAVAAGAEFSLALKRDGTVSAWGLAGVRTVPTGLAGVRAISACGALSGGQFAVALKTDGTVAAWGSNTNGQSNVPEGLDNIVAVAAGAFHVLALKANGTVAAWGSTTGGRTTVPPELPRITAIAASAAASFALAGTPFRLIDQPIAQSAIIDGSATFRVNATGSGPLAYQWRRNGVAIAGATGSTYTLARVTAGDVGMYDVIVTDAGTAFPSAAALLTISATPPPGGEVSRISNLSIRTQTGSGAQTLIVGFVVGGPGTTGTKSLLVRGIGPSLAAFGVTGVLGDPRVELYDGRSVKLLENDNWNANDATVFARVGAFALSPGSRDAALTSSTLAAGGYTVQVAGAGGESGIALAEIYDLTPAGSFPATAPRLINVSARTFSGTGRDVLIAGFVIAGTAPKTVLIRAIGPSLAQFGVTGVLANPRLDLFSGSNARLQENDDWGGSAGLVAAFTRVGAFPLAASSFDSAIVTTLPAGSYTVQVAGVGGGTGVALVEVYEVN